MAKKILLFLLVVLVVIQFFHPAKNINTTAAATANDISKVFPVPEHIQKILSTSCYDCHSNNTAYPWYSKVQPVAWWLNHHIEEGKREINFNEFAAYSLRRQYKKLDEVVEQVKKDEMPLGSYTLIHKDAILTDQQKEALFAWATAAMDTMKAKYPADSLLRKK